MLSLGAPMLLMGDEILHTQNGNNNAYCQDNELSWFDWDLIQKNEDIFRFVKILIKKRLKRESAQANFNLSLREFLTQSTIHWHGVKLEKPDWSENSHSIAMTVNALSGKMAMHYMVNAYRKPLTFEVPLEVDGKKVTWSRWIDTALDSPEDICLWQHAKPLANGSYHVEANSIVIILSKID
jgi:glycogen operon protein